MSFVLLFLKVEANGIDGDSLLRNLIIYSVRYRFEYCDKERRKKTVH